jgi:hypothetical protein
MVGTVKFEARIKELVENLPDLAILVEPLLTVRRVLREQITVLHGRLLAIVRDDDVCRRLMTVKRRPHTFYIKHALSLASARLLNTMWVARAHWDATAH